MRRLYFYLFFSSFSYLLSAQYTDQINSNRPGASIGAFSVGTRVIQFEAGENTDPINTKATTIQSKWKGWVLLLTLRFFKRTIRTYF